MEKTSLAEEARNSLLSGLDCSEILGLPKREGSENVKNQGLKGSESS